MISERWHINRLYLLTKLFCNFTLLFVYLTFSLSCLRVANFSTVSAACFARCKTLTNQKQMVRCDAPGQMSVLRGICCVTGCLNWKPAHNISTQCQSSDYPLVTANTHTVLTVFCHCACAHSQLFLYLYLSTLMSIIFPARDISQHAHKHTNTHVHTHTHTLSCHSWCCVDDEGWQQTTQHNSAGLQSLFWLFSLLILLAVHSLFLSCCLLTF